MSKPSHIIISRMLFSDKELLNKYLKITKEMLLPNLKLQINKNFVWGVLICAEDIDYVKNFLDVDFMPFMNKNEFISYVKLNNINIQTRHDIDDYMSISYIDKIQEIYEKNIGQFNEFLIQFQPLRVDYLTKKEFSMPKYTNQRNSMFLSLCQNVVNNHILEKQHGEMYEITKNIITIPEGYVKWIIHGNNITCKRTNIYN